MPECIIIIIIVVVIIIRYNEVLNVLCTCWLYVALYTQFQNSACALHVG
jgi:hypothetical protein